MHGHWQYDLIFDPDRWFGFIYLITDLDNGRQYIGTTSSAHVNRAIADRGKDRFRFTILSLHETRASLVYAEIEQQVIRDVLRDRLPSGERKFYNAAIGNVRFIPPDVTAYEVLHRSVHAETV